MERNKTLSCLAMFTMLLSMNLASAQERHEHKEGHESRERSEHRSTETTESDKGQKNVQGHADRLYAAAKQARKDLSQLRIDAGLHAHAAGPHIDPEGHHANDSPAQRERERNESEGHEDGEHREGKEREHREGREGEHREGGEHQEREHREGGEHRDRSEREHGHDEGEERGNAKPGERVAKTAKHILKYKNGAKLTLQYNSETQAFIGNVTNTTKKDLPDMRVEIHLSNGVELGPTNRTLLRPGKTIPIELGAFGEEFTHWTTHPETGNEEAHSAGDEENERAGGHGEHRGESEHGERGHAERERGEHGGRVERGEMSGVHSHEGGHGIGDSALGSVYNQLNLLRGEMSAFASDLKAKKNRN